VRVALLYALALTREFRWTLVALAVAVIVGTILFWITPHEALGGERPSVGLALLCAWMALLSQSVVASRPETWYLAAVTALYPLVGVLVIGEGVVRLALLLVSRRQGEKEWMRVMASTYRDHVVLCGLGHLGHRVLEQLAAAGTPVVALERVENARGMARARELRVPVLVRDMKEDQALIDAGIPHARAIVIATNDDMGNLEVALDARRMNPGIRVIMRLFDQQIADKMAKAFNVDVAFSSSALAAPLVAAMSLQSRVLSSCLIAGTQYVTAEVEAKPGSALPGRPVADVERQFAARLLHHGRPSGESVESLIAAGDALVFHVPATRLADLAAAGKPPA